MAKNKAESEFQKQLCDELRQEFPGCMILKNDSSYRQGIPDWIVLYKDKWAMLEAKRSIDAEHQPNQDYYVDVLDKMCYSSFVYPENKEEVINDLREIFEPRR